MPFPSSRSLRAVIHAVDNWDHLSNQVVISYASCVTQCTATDGWHILPLQTIEQGSSDLLQHSLLVDQAGRPHVSFQHSGLSYAGCNLNCSVPGSWFEVSIDATTGGTGVRSASSVVCCRWACFRRGSSISPPARRRGV